MPRAEKKAAKTKSKKPKVAKPAATEPVAKRPLGRPSVYSEALGDEICEEIAFSDLGIEHLCNRFDHWPSARTIHRWIESDEAFRQKYTRAREKQAEFMAEQIVNIADDSVNDTQVDDDGKTIVNFDHIARARLRVEARKWVAAKLLPKKYGERTTTEITGANGGPIQINAQRVIALENMDEESLQQLEQVLKLALSKPEQT